MFLPPHSQNGKLCRSIVFGLSQLSLILSFSLVVFGALIEPTPSLATLTQVEDVERLPDGGVGRWIQGSQGPLWTVFHPPQNPKLPVITLVNGLTYDLSYWSPLVRELQGRGFGVLRFDPVGQGKTLEVTGTPSAPIPIEKQAEDLKIVLDAYGLTRKGVHLAGLSYGGGLIIAFLQRYQRWVQNAFLMAPYTEPLEGQDLTIRSQILAFRMAFPFSTLTDDQLYGYFLQKNVYTVFPFYEPDIMFPVNKREAVYWLIEGIRKFDMFKASQSVDRPIIHLMIAGLDQYIPRYTLEKYWNQLPESARGTKIVFSLSEHKIPQAFPRGAADWIELVQRDRDHWIQKVRERGSIYDFELWGRGASYLRPSCSHVYLAQ